MCMVKSIFKLMDWVMDLLIACPASIIIKRQHTYITLLLLESSYLWNGVLCRFRGIVPVKVLHGAALGHIVHPHSLVKLTMGQVVKLARPILLVISPRTLISVLICCKVSWRHNYIFYAYYNLYDFIWWDWVQFCNCDIYFNIYKNIEIKGRK